MSSAMQYILRGNKLSLNSDYQDSFEDGDIALSTVTLKKLHFVSGSDLYFEEIPSLSVVKFDTLSL